LKYQVNINMKNYFIIFSIILILALRVESNASTREVTLDDVLVSYVEGNSVIRSENAVPGSSSKRENNNIRICGQLNDTGAINTFCYYTIVNDRIGATFCTLDERIYENVNKPVWVDLTAAGFVFDGSRNRIKPIGYSRLDGISECISRARKLCGDWALGARRNIDLNLYKKTDRLKKAFSKYSGSDLGRLEFRRPAAECPEYIDFANSKIALEAGRFVICESANRKDHLLCIAVFDLKTLEPLRIFVVNSGEFLE